MLAWTASQVSKQMQLEWKQMEGVNEKIQLTFFSPSHMSFKKKLPQDWKLSFKLRNIFFVYSK